MVELILILADNLLKVENLYNSIKNYNVANPNASKHCQV